MKYYQSTQYQEPRLMVGEEKDIKSTTIQSGEVGIEVLKLRGYYVP